MTATIKLGVSRCLLGDPVRYDGGHKHDRFITNTLGQYVTFIPVCPEVECGMSIPRESLRLVGTPENPRLITRKSQVDHTDRMVAWAQGRIRDLESEDLCGFIFKSDSPSSGMERVKVYNEKGMPLKKGVGIFAALFMAHFPLLPVEDEGRLNDPKLREHFIERIFVYKRLRDLLAGEKKTGALVEFHTRHKMLFMAHSPEHYRRMGKLVADASLSAAEKFSRYETLLGEALRFKTTVKKNANVLLHILGYFKKDLSPDEKQELLEIIGLYRDGHLPIIVPVTLLNHFVRKYDEPYLKKQYYLNPHPIELHLRNHV
ncbi:YbgA family protein [Desulfococcus sp.]|uniref:YbgA family protein n=1 Tax=Desulfococcus sp. TaxID=2025834 RepID=UPI003594176A